MRSQGVAAGFVTFFTMGLAMGSYGPALALLREHYGLGAGTGGLLVGVHAFAALLAVAVFALAGRRFSLDVRLLVLISVLAAGLAAFGLADSWSSTLAGAALIGFGFGGAATAFNAAFATGFGRRSTAMVALLNASIGVGSLTGPAIVGIDPDAFRRVFLGGAGLAVVSLVLLVLGGQSGVPRPRAVLDARSERMLHRRSVRVFALATFLYSGFEQSVGAWAAADLRQQGVSIGTASFVTAGFWAALAVGRLAMVPLALRHPDHRLVRHGLAMVVPVLAVTLLADLGMVTYAIAGLFMAPIFPCIVTWAGRTTGEPERMTTLVQAAGLAGSGLVPMAVGGVIDVTTAAVVPAVVTVLSGLCLATVLRAPVDGNRDQNGGRRTDAAIAVSA